MGISIQHSGSIYTQIDLEELEEKNPEAAGAIYEDRADKIKRGGKKRKLDYYQDAKRCYKTALDNLKPINCPIDGDGGLRVLEPELYEGIRLSNEESSNLRVKTLVSMIQRCEDKIAKITVPSN